MPDSRSGCRRRVAFAIAVVLTFAATWIGLDLTENRPRWLTVETPESAQFVRPLEIRVTLGKSVETTEINCTLHRANAGRGGRGYLASSGPSRRAVGGGTYSFVFTVPEHEATAFAFAVIYLSPTGRPQDSTKAASTKYMPVKGKDAASSDLRIRKTRVYHYPTAAESVRTQAGARTERPRGRPSVWVHPIIGLFLLAAASFSALKAGRTSPAAIPRRTRERTVWLIFAALLAASAVIELSGIAGHLAAWGRRFAEDRGVYELRRPAQKAIIAAVAALSLGLLLIFLRTPRRTGPDRSLFWAGIGLAAYLAVSSVSVLSFHAIDVARGLVWHGLSPVDTVRGAGAMVTFVASVLSLRGKAGRTPI